MSRDPFEETAPDRDYGPEWWAQGAELCKCGHRLDAHEDTWNAKDGASTPCGYSEGGVGWFNCCLCNDFAPALDNQ